MILKSNSFSDVSCWSNYRSWARCGEHRLTESLLRHQKRSSNWNNDNPHFHWHRNNYNAKAWSRNV